MSVIVAFPVRTVEVLYADDAREVWVISHLDNSDLPSLRHLLPAEIQDAPLVTWVPVEGDDGETLDGWVLSLSER